MNVKQEPEWRKSFMLRAYVHNSKLKNAAIRMVFQYWVTYMIYCIMMASFLHTKFIYSIYTRPNQRDDVIIILYITHKPLNCAIICTLQFNHCHVR